MKSDAKSQQPMRQSHARSAGVDLLRAVCIWCIAVDHGPGGGWWYASQNVFLVNLWVLYSVVGLSGVLTARSSGSLLQYELRLGALLAVGLACNVAGWRIAGEQWWHDRGHLVHNVIFQMYYILGLMVIGPFVESLRSPHRYPLLLAWLGAALSVAAVGHVEYWQACRVWVLLATCTVALDPKASQTLGRGAPRGALLVFAAAVVVPMLILGWGEGPHPFTAKITNCTACYLAGHMWGALQDGLDLEAFCKAVDTYWLLGLLVLLPAQQHMARVDLKAPPSAIARAQVMAAWGVILVIFARLTALRKAPADFLGLTPWLYYWSLAVYVGHQLLRAVTPGSYYNVLAASFIVAVAAGRFQTREAETKSLIGELPREETKALPA